MLDTFLSPEFNLDEYDSLEEFLSVFETSLRGINFYLLTYGDNLFFNARDTICTFRSEDELRNVYKNKNIDCAIKKLELKNVVDMYELYFPVYCVELHNSYKYVDHIMRDLMISKISGMMNKELGEEQ